MRREVPFLNFDLPPGTSTMLQGGVRGSELPSALATLLATIDPMRFVMYLFRQSLVINLRMGLLLASVKRGCKVVME